MINTINGYLPDKLTIQQIVDEVQRIKPDLVGVRQGLLCKVIKRYADGGADFSDKEVITQIARDILASDEINNSGVFCSDARKAFDDFESYHQWSIFRTTNYAEARSFAMAFDKTIYELDEQVKKKFAKHLHAERVAGLRKLQMLNLNNFESTEIKEGKYTHIAYDGPATEAVDHLTSIIKDYDMESLLFDTTSAPVAVAINLDKSESLADTVPGRYIIDLLAYLKYSIIPPMDIIQLGFKMFLVYATYTEVIQAIYNDLLFTIAQLLDVEYQDFIDTLLLSMGFNMHVPEEVSMPDMDTFVRLALVLNARESVTPELKTYLDKYKSTHKAVNIDNIPKQYKIWVYSVAEKEHDVLFSAATLKYLIHCYTLRQKEEKRLAKAARKRAELEARTQQEKERDARRAQRQKEKLVNEAKKFRDTCSVAEYYNEDMHLRDYARALYFGDDVIITEEALQDAIKHMCQEIETRLEPQINSHRINLKRIIASGDKQTWESYPLVATKSAAPYEILGLDEKAVETILENNYYALNSERLHEVLSAYDGKYWTYLYINKSTSEFKATLNEVASVFDVDGTVLLKEVRAAILQYLVVMFSDLNDKADTPLFSNDYEDEQKLLEQLEQFGMTDHAYNYLSKDTDKAVNKYWFDCARYVARPLGLVITTMIVDYGSRGSFIESRWSEMQEKGLNKEDVRQCVLCYEGAMNCSENITMSKDIFAKVMTTVAIFGSAVCDNLNIISATVDSTDTDLRTNTIQTLIATIKGNTAWIQKYAPYTPAENKEDVAHILTSSDLLIETLEAELKEKPKTAEQTEDELNKQISEEYALYSSNKPVWWDPTATDRTAVPKLNTTQLMGRMGLALTRSAFTRFIEKLPADALPSEEVYKYTVDKLNAYNKKIENRVTDPFTGKSTSVLALCREYGVSRKHYEEMLASGKTKQQALIIPAKDLKIIAASYQAQGIRYDKNGKYIVYRSNYAVTVSYKDLVKVKQKLNL